MIPESAATSEEIKREGNVYTPSTKEVVAGLGVLIVFFVSAYLSFRYADSLRSLLIGYGSIAGFVYVAWMIIGVVIAPIATTPLIPVAAALWGSLTAAALTIFGWTIGATIAFVLAQRYGRPLVQKVALLSTIERVAVAIPKERLFWGVVFLRMAFAVDVLSYAIGLFTTMPLVPYVGATVIGITPYTLLLSYAVRLPIWYQIGVVLIGLALFSVGVRRMLKKKSL